MSLVDESLSATALDEQTVAWEHAKDLPFVGTDASLNDKTGFKSTGDSDQFNKSMVKSKEFGQSKPLEGDLLANIEVSEFDEIFAPVKMAPVPQSISVQPQISPKIEVDGNFDSSMHTTITKIELENPQSKDLATIKFDKEDSPNRILSNAAGSTSETSGHILSPQRQTSEELLQVLNTIQTAYPIVPEAQYPETSTTNQTNGNASSSEETNKTSNQQKHEPAKVSTKKISSKEKKEESVVSINESKKSLVSNVSLKVKQQMDTEPLSSEEMVNAAEVMAMKARKPVAPTKKISESSMNAASRQKSRPVVSLSDPDSNKEANSKPGEAKEDVSSHPKPRKPGLPPLQKRPTPRRKDDSVYADTATEDPAALGDNSIVRNSDSKSAAAKRKPFLPDINGKEPSGVNASPVKAAALNKKRELMQQYTRKVPPKDPSRLKLPPIAGSASQQKDRHSVEDDQSLVSQETPGRGMRRISDNQSSNARALSSPPFSRNSGSNRDSEQENSTTSPKKRRKPLYLRMIAKAEKLLMEEERKKQESYNRIRALRPKHTPSREELKEHASKFEEFMKSKAELSRQNHVAQIRALKEQRRQQQSSKDITDGNSVDLAGDETSLDGGDSMIAEQSPIKGAAKVKLQKELDRIDQIKQSLDEQKKERNRMYKGLMKKAGLVPESEDDLESNKITSVKKSPRPHAHEATPPKKSKSKVAVSLHVVTVGDDSEIINGSPRNIALLESKEAHDKALLPHLEPHHNPYSNVHSHKKTPRQSTPHKASFSVPDDEDAFGGEGTASFSMLDVLDDEAMEVLNHHRHAGEPIESGVESDDNLAEGEERMSISLADYVPALNEQPLPETVKVTEGFFDDILGNRSSVDQADIVKVITHDDDDDDDLAKERNRSYTATTSGTVGNEEEDDASTSSFILSRDPTEAGSLTQLPSTVVTEVIDVLNPEDNREVINVPDLSEKEVAYFVADDWIDMLANTSMSMEAPGEDEGIRS